MSPVDRRRMLILSLLKCAREMRAQSQHCFCTQPCDGRQQWDFTRVMTEMIEAWCVVHAGEVMPVSVTEAAGRPPAPEPTYLAELERLLTAATENDFSDFADLCGTSLPKQMR